MALKKLGLCRIYLGIESGDDEVLNTIQKDETAASLTTAGKRVRALGLFLSGTVLLGIGGRALSLQHAEATGKILTAIRPHQISALTLMVIPNTPLAQLVSEGLFTLPSPLEIIKELRTIIENTDCDKVQFFCKPRIELSPDFRSTAAG